MKNLPASISAPTIAEKILSQTRSSDPGQGQEEFFNPAIKSWEIKTSKHKQRNLFPVRPLLATKIVFNASQANEILRLFYCQKNERRKLQKCFLYPYLFFYIEITGIWKTFLKIVEHPVRILYIISRGTFFSSSHDSDDEMFCALALQQFC